MKHIVDLFRGRPLIYNTLRKTGLYVIMSLLFHMGELVLQPMLEYNSALIARKRLMAAIREPRFRAIQLWLLPFVATKGLVSATGAGRIRQLFLGR